MIESHEAQDRGMKVMHLLRLARNVKSLSRLGLPVLRFLDRIPARTHDDVGRQILPLNSPIQRASQKRRPLRELDGRSAYALVQTSRDRKDGVAERFQPKPTPIHFPQQSVLRIDLPRLSTIVTRLLINAGKHDPSNQTFCRPVVLDRLQREPMLVPSSHQPS